MNPLLEWAYHNIDPTAFTVPGAGLEVKWYGLSYMLTFVVSWLILMRLQKGGYLRLAKDDVSAIIMYAIVGVFLGGRFGYMLFYSDYFYHSGPGSFIDDPGALIGFAKGEGFKGLAGLSFHGGLMGVIVSLSLYSWIRARWQIRAELKSGIEIDNVNRAIRKRWKVVAAELMDSCTLAAPIGIVFVRLANFVNGELYGRIIEDEASAPAWAMRFPTSPEGNGAMRSYLGTPEATEIIRSSLSEDASVEAINEARNAALHLPVNEEIWGKVSEYVALRHPSQLYQALCEGLAVALILWFLRAKMKVRGMVGGLFLMGYALGRVPMEYFRQPDKQFEDGQDMSGWGGTLANMGLTQGQLLSYAMLVGGAVILVLCARSKNESMRRTPEQLSLNAEPMSDILAGIKGAKADHEKTA